MTTSLLPKGRGSVYAVSKASLNSFDSSKDYPNKYRNKMNRVCGARIKKGRSVPLGPQASRVLTADTLSNMFSILFLAFVVYHLSHSQRT